MVLGNLDIACHDDTPTTGSSLLVESDDALVGGETQIGVKCSSVGPGLSCVRDRISQSQAIEDRRRED